MDFDIKEIGATILIGAFFFLSIEASLYFFLGIDLTGFFRGRIGFSDENRPRIDKHRQKDIEGIDSFSNTPLGVAPPPVPFTVFIAISILLGVFAEDIAMKFLETAPSRVTRYAEPVSKIGPFNDGLGIDFSQFDTKDKQRAGALGKERRENYLIPDRVTFDLNPLGKELASLGEFDFCNNSTTCLIKKIEKFRA